MTGWRRTRTRSHACGRVSIGRISRRAHVAEFQLLLRASHARANADPTGRHHSLHRSELLTLKWADIDFERLEINPRAIIQQVVRLGSVGVPVHQACYVGRSISRQSGTGVKMPSNFSTSFSQPTILDSAGYTPSRGISLRTKIVSWVGSDSHSMVNVVTG